MTTQLLSGDDSAALAVAAAAIAGGELVVLPTDTVYGVAADAFEEAAIRRLFVAKLRPFEKGIPILISDVNQLQRVARELAPGVQDLIDRFWPGPLTLVLPKRRELPPSVSQSDGVAVRLPDHTLCREIIRAAGGAVAATSANLSGRPPALDVNMALRDLGGSIAVAVDGGPSGGQLASTVLDCTASPMHILRPGPIPSTELGITPGQS